MSRAIEDRLVAALEARAELVRPEDLGPIQVPERPRRPRPGVVLLLAAAAAAVAIGVPFALGGGGASPEPDPTGPSSVVPSPSEPGPSEPAPTEATPPTVPSGMAVADRQRADVDGDGRPDEVRLMLESTQEEPSAGIVAVSLAAGGTVSAEVPLGYPRLLPAFDVNGDGHDQVLVSHTAGGDSAQLLVYTWYDGGLVPARVDGDAPLALDLDGQGRVDDYYTDDRGLFSWRRLGPADPAGGTTFKVEQWSWSVDGDRLVPTPAEPGCVDVTSQDPPQQCAG